MNHTAAKDTLILIEISRKEVEAGDITHIAILLGQLTGDRASLLSSEGCVSLMFGGYDQDSRPLHAIPEVRAWFQALTEARPYWSILANRTDETVGTLMALLLPGVSEPGELPGQYGWRFDMSGLQPLLNKLFSGQRHLMKRLEIGEQDNSRIARDFNEAVSASIDCAS